MAAVENTTNNPPPEAVALTVIEEKPETKEEIPDNPPASEPKKVIMRGVKALKSKKIVLPVALITFLLSIPVLFSAIWLLYIRQYDCEGLLKNLPRLQIGIGIGMLLIFFLSNAVVYTRTKFPVPGLIFIMMLMIVTLVMGLGIIGDFKMESRRIVASPRWFELKSGCCTPPTICEMEFVNATYWRRGNIEIDSTIPYDRDCDIWQNDESMLCYDCNACKDGFVRTLEAKWLKLGTFLSVMSLLLMISHLLLFVATMWEQYGG
ncbi:Tetraspanin-15 [Forsythia ovata]|uniref:Tetraspanin-15 n=1 Tax=Forsythia ovata TaxID=205694 RepID=A0ABD1SRF0_9LAMI